MYTYIGLVRTLAGAGLSTSTDGLGTAATFASPYGIALSTSGGLFVADSGISKIRFVSSAGQFFLISSIESVVMIIKFPLLTNMHLFSSLQLVSFVV